jgi:hypothetical protein
LLIEVHLLDFVGDRQALQMRLQVVRCLRADGRFMRSGGAPAAQLWQEMLGARCATRVCREIARS